MFMKKIVFLAGIFLFAAHLSNAQKSTVSGIVSDKQSAEPLQYATVFLKNKQNKATRFNTLSGLNGGFVFRNIPAGDYELEIRFVGYPEDEENIVVGSAALDLKVQMDHQKQQLKEVSFVGRRDKGSDLSAIQVDRRASIVQNSVSARTIEISPDLSVANTAQRVSGVSLERSTNGEGQYVIIRGMDKRYIYTLVNGIKIPSPDSKNRYVPLDIFPADLLDRLEVTKSLTPDMEGDAIGGAVNMVMKDAPSQFSVKANAAIGYADKFFSQDYNKFDHGPSRDRSPYISNGQHYLADMKDFPNSAFSHETKANPLASLFGLSLGGRLLKDKLGVLVAGSYQNNYRNVNTVFFGTETDMNNGDAKVTSIESRNYSIQQQRSGLHAKLDYRINDKNHINLYAALLNLQKNEYRYAADTSLQLGRQGPGTGRINTSYRNLHDVQQITNITLTGDHQVAKNFGLNWIAAYSKATDNRPDEATLNLNNGVSREQNGQLDQTPQTLSLDSYREFLHNSDEDKSGYLNLTYKSRIGALKLDWLAGGMYRSKTRTSTYDSYDLRPTNPTNQIYDGDINNNNLFVFNPTGTPDDALNYTAKENVGAAYAMLKLGWNKFEVAGGARYEHTDLDWNSNVEKTTDGKTGSITYYDVLPSANIKFSLSKKQTLRLSYYSAISRPNFYEVIPHTGGDPDADYQEKGNPNLKRTTADNFDLRYDFYPKGLDQFLAGIFYKRLNNPIEYALEDEGTFLYYKADNFGKASNYGLELDMTKYFRWFGIRANYTFTNSRITTPKQLFYSIPGGTSSKEVDQTRPLQGQSKHIANLSLLFKDDNKLGLNAQLAFGYTSRRINTVSQFLDNDIWQKGFVQMDFSVEKRLARRWYVYAKINNLLNTPYQLEIRRPYTGSGVVGDVTHQQLGKNVFVRKDTYGANYLLGIKFKL
jgi:outer membrane cobalamin receptor